MGRGGPSKSFITEESPLILIKHQKDRVEGIHCGLGRSIHGRNVVSICEVGRHVDLEAQF